MKQILTESQLKKRLVDYDLKFTDDQFKHLMKLGFYHVFNSFVPKKIRENGNEKKLSDYLFLYKLDRELSSIIFPMIVELESFLKQRLNDVLLKEVLGESLKSPHYNNIVQYCIREKNNLSAKKLLFKSTNNSNPIVDHYFKNHNDIPIWGYIELLTLNDFLQFYNFCTISQDYNPNRDGVKEKFLKAINFTDSSNNIFGFDGKKLSIYQIFILIKDVRNNIAHNQPVIDNRFIKGDYKVDIISNVLNEIAPKVINRTIYDSTFNFKQSIETFYLIFILYLYFIGNDFLIKNMINFFDDKIVSNSYSISSNVLERCLGRNYLYFSNLIRSN